MSVYHLDSVWYYGDVDFKPQLMWNGSSDREIKVIMFSKYTKHNNNFDKIVVYMYHQTTVA